jgi:hypothetical protein
MPYLDFVNWVNARGVGEGAVMGRYLLGFWLVGLAPIGGRVGVAGPG